MNDIIQGQLDRVDSALNNLVESIASYNPSTIAAKELLTADEELCRGVETLSKHQANYARIIALRSQVSSLNVSITNTVTTLADMHTEILAQNITPVGKTSQQVPYRALLDYAASISRYTIPKIEPRRKKENSSEESATVANGADHNQQQDAHDGSKDEQPGKGDPGRWSFVPWPTEGIIKQGALGRIQALLEVGQDPDTVHVMAVEELKAEDTMQIAESQDPSDVAREEQTRPLERERRESKTEQKPKVFGGLDLYDPNDMDDD